MKFIEKVAEKYGLEKTDLQKDYAQHLAKEHGLSEKQVGALAVTELSEMDEFVTQISKVNTNESNQSKNEDTDPGAFGRELAERTKVHTPAHTYFKD